MKYVAVIANTIGLAKYIKYSLDAFFSPHVTIHTFTTDDVAEMEQVEEQVVVISAYVIFKQVQQKIRPDAVLQTFSQVLSRDNIKRLQAEDIGQRVLLVSVDYYNCAQTIAQLHQAGFTEVDFVPYSGDEATRDKSIDVAVTPNEEQLVPSGMKKIVNIGERTVDINCVIELAEKLGVKDIFSSSKAAELRGNMITSPGGMDRIFSEAESASEKIRSLAEYMDDGVNIIDLSGRIYLANQKAKDIVGMEDMFEGFAIQEMLPEIDLGRDHGKGHEMLLQVGGRTIIAMNQATYSRGHKSGSIITIKNYEEIEERQYVVRNRLSGRSHVACHEFSDIKGSSAVIRSKIESAGRMARSNASVLITGPSGCGKEIFAQSIHNASLRRSYNFVALNCAAIPENLLESELFGYESGAFTGAKKEGKIGYFELAHRGTIFLDEIGEMPMALQSKLLRVIEERSFAKIGSSKLIDVDIRVIAATNQDLDELVREKRFREDLFFRLNVLPLNLPPIRERGQDAMELLYVFREENHWTWQLSPEAETYLSEYEWPGNIREIRNVAEYLESLERDEVGVGDLPPYIRGGRRKKAETAAASADHVRDGVAFLRQSDNLSFILREGQNLDIHLRILRVLSGEGEKNLHTGRLKLMECFAQDGEMYSEAEVRNCLRKLSESGYIKSRRGPGGSHILPRGQSLLADLKVLLG